MQFVSWAVEQRNMSEFSCCSQLRNDLQIQYPFSNNGLTLAFPLLSVEGCEAGERCFLWGVQGNRDLRKTSSVNAHSRPGPLRQHVTVNVLKAQRSLSVWHISPAHGSAIMIQARVNTFQTTSSGCIKLLNIARKKNLQLINQPAAISFCWETKRWRWWYSWQHVE